MFRRLTAEEHARRRDIYRQARDDKEAAAWAGITRSGFTYWRQGQRLPAKEPPVREPDPRHRNLARRQCIGWRLVELLEERGIEVPEPKPRIAQEAF
jgi:hypothetical protein